MPARLLASRPRGRSPGAELGLTVLPGWSATLDRQQFIEREISQRLPGVEWGASYHLGGTPRRIAFARPLPGRRGRAAGPGPGSYRGNNQGKPVVGVNSRGEIVYIDLDKETPHIGLSIGTGGGKSDWLKLIIMRLITKGVERIVIIDPKGS